MMAFSFSYMWFILGVTILASLIAFGNETFFNKNKFVPYLINRNPMEWFRFISSGFIHADFMHLFLNMFVFYSFGSNLNYYFNDMFGTKANLYFLFLYISAIAVSEIPTYVKNRNNPHYASIGASGAVAAITFANILISPTSDILMMGIRMPAIVFGVIYLAAEYFLGKRKGDNINHDAHFWGAVYGFVFTGVLQPQLFTSFIGKVLSLL
jgi:membrane associated rhomboid family serine protease